MLCSLDYFKLYFDLKTRFPIQQFYVSHCSLDKFSFLWKSLCILFPISFCTISLFMRELRSFSGSKYLVQNILINKTKWKGHFKVVEGPFTIYIFPQEVVTTWWKSFFLHLWFPWSYRIICADFISAWSNQGSVMCLLSILNQ